MSLSHKYVSVILDKQNSATNHQARNSEGEIFVDKKLQAVESKSCLDSINKLTNLGYFILRMKHRLCSVVNIANS